MRAGYPTIFTPATGRPHKSANTAHRAGPDSSVPMRYFCSGGRSHTETLTWQYVA
jgi:hypothetical protein